MDSLMFLAKLCPSVPNSQVISQAHPGEDNRSSQAGPPHGEASTSPAPLHASSQAGEDSALPQAGATPPGEDASLSQVSTPPSLPPYLSWGRCQSFPGYYPPYPPSLPAYPSRGRCQSSSGQYTPYPLPSQPTALLPSPEDRGPPNLPNTQAGQSNNPTNYPRQGSRQPPRQRPPRPPRRFILPPGKAITPPPPH